MKLQELKTRCLAAADAHPASRGEILDLYYDAEDAVADGDEAFECAFAADALTELIDRAEMDDITGTEDYLNDSGAGDDDE